MHNKESTAVDVSLLPSAITSSLGLTPRIAFRTLLTEDHILYPLIMSIGLFWMPLRFLCHCIAMCPSCPAMPRLPYDLACTVWTPGAFSGATRNQYN